MEDDFLSCVFNAWQVVDVLLPVGSEKMLPLQKCLHS
jgi:hypothetical protein